MPEDSSNEVYAVFAGMIDQGAVTRFFNGITGAIGSGRTKIHLAIQSGGGTVSDGVALYNFFRAVTIPLAIYNIGGCYSIASIAYLGGHERKVSAHAAFMLHRTTGAVQSASATQLRTVTKSVVSDNERTEAILRQRLRLSDDHWMQLNTSELWITAQDAVDCNLATSVEEFSPPIRTQIFNI